MGNCHRVRADAQRLEIATTPGALAFRNNVKRELIGRKFPEIVASEIVNEIFGKQIGATFVEGLVDAESTEAFLEMLELKKEEWAVKDMNKTIKMSSIAKFMTKCINQGFLTISSKSLNTL